MATSVKLDCVICPTRPHFSDISHLLTHLASKGHLKHEHEAFLRAEEDENFRTTIFAPFRQWLVNNNLNVLLRERQRQKKKKDDARHTPQPRASAAGAASASTINQRQGSSLAAAQYTPVAPYVPTAPIDPELMEGQAAELDGLRRSTRKAVKREIGGLTTHAEYDSDDLDERDAPGPYPTAPGYSYAPAVHRDIARTQGYLNSRPSSRQDSISPTLQPLNHNKRRASDAFTGDDQIDRWSTASVMSQEKDDSMVSEAATLKGVRWPGMDLFDSASPHAKRIRNQKKDISILQAMETYSQTIEPIETIRYIPSWKVKKRREITGQVESSEEELSPEPKQTRDRPYIQKAKGRAALFPLDSNQSLKSHTRTGKNVQQAQAEDADSNSSEILPQLNAGIPTLWSNAHEDDDDWKLNFSGGLVGQRMPKIGVFRDDGPGGSRARRARRNEDAEMFVATTPTPTTQLPPMRLPSNVQTPTPQPSLGSGAFASDMMTGNRGAANIPFGLDKGVAHGEMSDMSNPFATKIAYENSFGQRYFSMSDGQPVQFSNTIPQYMDFAIGHQSGRLMQTNASFGNAVQNGFGMSHGHVPSANGIENPLGVYPSRTSVNQSPLRVNQSPSSMNPLLDFSQFMETAGNGPDTDNDTIDEMIGANN